MEKLLEQFETHLARPEQYLIGSNVLRNKCLELNQGLFGSCNSGRFPAGPLTSLHTKGFDNDQIWEQIQLLNRPIVKYAKKRSKEIGEMATGYSALLPQVAVENDDQSEMELLSESSYSTEDYSRKTLPSGDRFFKRSEMNQFLQEEDRKYENSRNQQPVDNFDLFRETSEDEGDLLMYDDFFDPPNDNDLDDDDDANIDHEVISDSDHDLDDDEDSHHQSTHQRQQQKVSYSTIVLYSRDHEV